MLLQLTGYALQGFVAWVLCCDVKKNPGLKEIAWYAKTIAVVDFLRFFLEVSRPHGRLLATADELSFLIAPVLLGLMAIRDRRRSNFPYVVAVTAIWMMTIVAAYPTSAAYSVYELTILPAIAAGWWALAFKQPPWGLQDLIASAYLSCWSVVLCGRLIPVWDQAVPLFWGMNCFILTARLLLKPGRPALVLAA